MTKARQTFRTEVSGLWSPRHRILDDEGRELGVLSVHRNRFGMVVSGEYRPERGEVLSFRRDPGILRGQFSLWTDGKEWLGSSLRWNVVRRQIDVQTGSKPLRIVPALGWRRGWRLVAPKTGRMARIETPLFSRNSTLQVYRKMDFELLLFAYFLGSLILTESLLPTALDALESATQEAAAAS